MAPRPSSTPKSVPSQTPVLQLVLTLLLVIAAFLVGSLWTKLQTLQSKQVGTATGAGQPATDQSTQATLTVDKLPEIAGSVGVDKQQFQSCLQSGRMAQIVKDDEQSGTKAGVNGTPGSVLLDTKTGFTRFIPGSVPYDQLKSAIDDLLAEANGTPSSTKGQPIPVDPVSDKDHIRGDRNARIALIEYSDLQCPFCKQFHPTVVRALQEYDGKIFWVYRHFPLDNLHPTARKAAEGSECVNEVAGQDGFWKYVDKIFEG